MSSYFHNVYILWSQDLSAQDKERARMHQSWFDDGDLTYDTVIGRVETIARESKAVSANFAFEVEKSAFLLRLRSGSVRGPIAFSLPEVSGAEQPGTRTLRFAAAVPDTVRDAIRSAEDKTQKIVEHEIVGNTLLVAGFCHRDQILPIVDAIAAVSPEVARKLAGLWQLGNAAPGSGWVRLHLVADRFEVSDEKFQHLEGTPHDADELHWTFETAYRSRRVDGLSIAMLPS